MKKFRLFLVLVTILSILLGVAVFLFTGGLSHNVLPLVSAGEKYLGEGDYEQAMLSFDRAIAIAPKTARAWYGMARSSVGSGDTQAAIEYLNTVATLAPDQADKVEWMIGKIEAGEGEDLILLPYRDNVTSDTEFTNLSILSDDKEVVLVLDTSGSMMGSPLQSTLSASSNFIHTVLDSYADIGVVIFSNSAEKVCDFTMNESALQQALHTISAGGGTNTSTGLQMAYDMLRDSGAKNRVIVLMSDGESGDDPTYVAQQIKDDGITIYTLGFFESVGYKGPAQTVMETIASDGCHYEVDREGALTEFFADVAEQINGQKYYYVRLECPVDVEVSYNGETLSSKGAEESKRTSFGTLTFEDNTEEDIYSEETESTRDDRVKILRLKEGVDYDISISGNGKGKMNYTIGFMDDDGKYSDLREFKSIEVNKHTEIQTQAKISDATMLEVDDDGDGEVDTTYRATANSKGEIYVAPDYTKYIVKGVAILVAFVILLIVIAKIKKRKRAQ